MIHRILETAIRDSAGNGKAVILLGARQVGKTTLVRELFSAPGTLWLNGDEPDVRAMFSEITSTRLRAVIGAHKTVVIDEAQRIADIGVKLKLITDQMPDVRLVATGSSSFDLARQVSEPLTGRKRTFRLYPLSFAEMAAHHGLMDETRLLPHRLVFGCYPEVVTSPGSERDALRELSDSYLYKDVLSWDRVKKSEKLTHLLRALAFQIGAQVSYAELAQLCGLDSKTVEKYVVILEQAFVIFRLGSFSRNLRNELKASRKIFFTDNGIRNAVIADFRPVENRDDVGKLWENFLISERFKRNHYAGNFANAWFWRTQQQQETDYLEEIDGRLAAYEFKWNPAAKAKKPKSFLEAYPNSSFEVVHRENFHAFVL
ncbi:MAG: ATP-binding protein [Clostridiales Family XIII bacterium]|jgi:predicted AAA+ superfamily ATPase|nr:ATP-binding protein [Clostridiales Family XIII bacterium]